MLKDIVISKIYINKTAKDGSPLVNQKGQPYVMAVLENSEGKKASCYIGQFHGAWDKKLDVISKWKSGDKVRVSLLQNGQYINFSLPTKTEELEERVVKLEQAVFGAKNAPVSVPKPEMVKDTTPAPKATVEAEFSQEEPPIEVYNESEAPINPQDIPF